MYSNSTEPAAVVLDTHVWVWAMEGAEQLRSTSAVFAIEQASEAGLLYLAAVSLFELAELQQAERVQFTIPLDDWVRQALETPGLTVVQPGERVALEAARLPGRFAGDLIDRFIVSTARTLGALLITADSKLIAYAEAGHLTAVDASSASDHLTT